MKVNYKVVGYRPDYEWIEVEFTHPDQPDQTWVRRFNFPDFSRDKLIEQIRLSRLALPGRGLASRSTLLSCPYQRQGRWT